MTYHGWVWRRGHWRHACAAHSVRECARLLDEMHPGLPNLHYAVTGGQAPDWVPGKLWWET